MAGRSTDYTDEIADLICAEIMEGKPLIRILRDNENMPCSKTVYTWLRLNESFLQNYREAKESQADHFADEMIEIADNATAQDAQVAKLRIDTRRWAASKFNMKKYGDRQTIEHEGEVKNTTPVLNIYTTEQK